MLYTDNLKQTISSYTVSRVQGKKLKQLHEAPDTASSLLTLCTVSYTHLDVYKRQA